MATSTTDRRHELGRSGEDAVLGVYRARGFRPVARNWRCALGELDLVLARGGALVVCEVKTRSGSAFGQGYESVTWIKRRKLRQLAQAFVAATGRHEASIRFDVASVMVGSDGFADVEVYQDAF